MDVKNYFDISRFWLLLKMEFFRSRKALLMTFVISFGLLFFAGLLLVAVFETRKVYDEHPGNYAFNLIIGGFILSSLAFNDLGNTLRRYHYLTLPASTFEKFLCMWLFTSVGWIFVFTTIYTLYTLVANVIGAALFNNLTFQAFDPRDDYNITTIRIYIVLQGLFLLGAVHFKGYVFPKTLFAMILFLTVCGIISYIVMRDIFFTDHDCGTGECPLLNQMAEHDVWTITQLVFWWALAPISWVAAYVGLKDQEV